MTVKRTNVAKVALDMALIVVAILGGLLLWLGGFGAIEALTTGGIDQPPTHSEAMSAREALVILGVAVVFLVGAVSMRRWLRRTWGGRPHI
jgi:hypothetical protein